MDKTEALKYSFDSFKKEIGWELLSSSMSSFSKQGREYEEYLQKLNQPYYAPTTPSIGPYYPLYNKKRGFDSNNDGKIDFLRCS